MSSRYTSPLLLLFLGGLMVAVSAPLKNSYPTISSILFYSGYAVDVAAVVLFIKIRFKKS